MAASKSHEELHERIIELVPEKTGKELKQYVAISEDDQFQTEFLRYHQCGFAIVHARSLMAAILVVLESLEDEDREMIYDQLMDFLYITPSTVKMIFRGYVRIKKMPSETPTHLYEVGNARSIKRAG